MQPPLPHSPLYFVLLSVCLSLLSVFAVIDTAPVVSITA